VHYWPLGVQGTAFTGSLHLADVATAVLYETVEGWKAGLGGYTVVGAVCSFGSWAIDWACL
jgi:hypothetical protein